ncbi:S8 family serine peptidase [bacterium]|nr:S8 family serine peptidase [bacterium]
MIDRKRAFRSACFFRQSVLPILPLLLALGFLIPLPASAQLVLHGDLSPSNLTVHVGETFTVDALILNSTSTAYESLTATLFVSPAKDTNTGDDVTGSVLTITDLPAWTGRAVRWEFSFPATPGAPLSYQVWLVASVEGQGVIGMFDDAVTVYQEIPVRIQIAPEHLTIIKPADGLRVPVYSNSEVSVPVTLMAAVAADPTVKSRVRVSSDFVVVRFKSAPAADLHGRRLATGQNRVLDYSRDLSALGLQDLPAGCRGVRPFRSGESKALAAVGAGVPAVLQAVREGRNLTSDESAWAASAVSSVATGKGPIGLFMVEIAPGCDPWAVAEALCGRSDVVYAHPSRICQPFLTPNDPFFEPQWYLTRTGTKLGWDVSSQYSDEVRVCVIDRGVRLSHEDLAARIVDPADVFPGNGDAYGDSNPDNDDPDGHGTAVAGIIGAIRNNGLGIAGQSPALIIPVNAGDDNGGISNYPDGVYWGVDHGATVINMSFGAFGPPAQAEIDAADYAEEHDVLGVAASGNDDTGADNVYPAAIPWYISVGAVSDRSEDVTEGRKNDRVRRDDWGWGSNYGSTLDVVAPGDGRYGAQGVHIYTLGRASNSSYRSGFYGTSAASAQVSGLCALIKKVKPALTARQIRFVVESTAEDLVGREEEDKTGWDKYHGYGLIDVEKAVLSARNNAYFTIFNQGTHDLKITSIQAADLLVGPRALVPQPDWLSWWPSAPLTIGPLGSQVVGVAADFRKRKTPASDMLLLIYSNDSARSPYPDGVHLTVLPKPSLVVIPWDLMK